jgi:hypothetical protein
MKLMRGLTVGNCGRIENEKTGSRLEACGAPTALAM